MRAGNPPVQYIVGTPKGRLTKLEKKLTQLPWQQAREDVEVKLLPEAGELYVFAQSRDRVNKERAMRRRQMKWLRGRLRELAASTLARDVLLMKLGAARQQARLAWRLFEVNVRVRRRRKHRKGKIQKVNTRTRTPALTFKLRWDKLRQVRRREGRYLLRSNMPERPPAQLWEFYLQLVQVEQAFANLKGDLSLRPIYH